MKETLHIYFTSDLHSHFRNWPNLTYQLNKHRQKHEDNQDFYLILDNGDHLDRVNPITEATLGQANIELLNQARYDIVTLGNNEGITLSHQDLYQLYEQANFKVVCANVYSSLESNPPWLKTYEIFETDQGTRIGVIGLTAGFKLFYEKLGWIVEDPMTTLDQLLPEVRSQSDVVILLSHLGAYEDEAIAEKFPVDVILGGHTHHLFQTGQIANQTIMNAVGKHGHYYGNVRIEYDHQSKQVTNMEGHALPISSDEDSMTVKKINELQSLASDIMSQVVTEVDKDYPIDWFKETSVMKAFVQELQNWTGAEAAMLNSGVLLRGFNQGQVTKKDIHESCPHPMNPCTMVLSGQELIETVRMLESERFIHFELKGLGFRGEVIGKMVYSNIEIEYHGDSNYVETIFLNGEEVDPEREYTIATADTFSFPWLLPTITSVKEKHYYMPEFIRDVLEECLSKLY
ncbi:bifunctional metallophosphatase/5'-nucleotidase [Alkalibacillus aidingensis]|uniref:bifunctional metallophosphatase/5'-nucleotidase n=1 Tax=Alkalibacillus aidingensis TaxID=2747607 RepID=UPI0016601ADA|nr:bifunctional UDP-sugar hydrolase/5'-nucleotidase [Alkalibacillus aidingensis]